MMNEILILYPAAPYSLWPGKYTADLTPRLAHPNFHSILKLSLNSSTICFMFFLGLFELGSLLSGVATSSKMFIVGRAVAGMGGSGIVNGGLTIVAKCIPMEKRGGMRILCTLFE